MTDHVEVNEPEPTDLVVNQGEPEGVEPDDDKVDYIEFVGLAPYGTEFHNGDLGTHSIDKTHMKKYHDIDLGAKEVVWRKGPNGRMLVPVTDMSPEAAELLAKDPMFKRVTL